ncbi:MAG: hypothetical protein HFE75_04585 [Firmicutes bacterium]|jgi:hypothetical protein|nr:hypothetical protein [Bacillota bacterium]
MDIHTKPILRYTETTVKLWPDSIRDALEYFLKEFEQLPSGHGMSKEFRTPIDSVYREGYKDGLELCHWLENGAPKLNA